VAQKPGVTTEGIRDLQRDLRAIDRKLPREIDEALTKAVADVVLPRARQLAPRRSGRLAASLRAGPDASVRSDLPYAGPIHWGWPARGIRAGLFAQRAFEERLDEAVDRLGDAVEDLAARNGFRRGL
jgi:hypothetical protein